MSHCCALASVSALVMLTVFPVTTWTNPQPYDTQTQSDARCCEVQDFALKRFDDVDQDSFVGLFGRRSAPKPRILDRILGGLLRRTSGFALSSEKVQKGFSLIKEHPRSRFERRQTMDMFV